MIQIPDLSHMLVNVRVPEAMVSYLHSEEDPHDKSTWQHAQIKVDAFSSRLLKGHIKLVDTVASQQDWFAADVKVYKTMISIDQSLEGLKPGMSAEVTILADESPTPVLVVPVQSVVGTISMGAKRKCFVVDTDGQPELRDIVVGMSNERLVEVKAGLAEGEQIVMNPQPLLKEDSDLKPGKVRSKSDDDSQGQGGSDSGKKGGKKKGNGASKGPEGGKGPVGPGPVPGPGPGPGAGEKGPPGGGAPTEQQKQAFMEKFRQATPAQRRDWINAIPDPAVRERVRQALREKGMEVAD
jgi:hypothetical protein